MPSFSVSFLSRITLTPNLVQTIRQIGEHKGRQDDLLTEINREADLRNCFTETDACLEGSDRQW